MTLFMITGPIFRTSQAMLWLAGSVHTATWREVGMIAPPLPRRSPSPRRPWSARCAFADLGSPSPPARQECG